MSNKGNLFRQIQDTRSRIKVIYFVFSSFSVIFHFLNFSAQIYILNHYAAIAQFKIRKRLHISEDSADNFRIVDLLSLLISRLI